MTEKIIIDGVNVAECCCYENSKCLWTKRYYENNIVPVCEKVKDCYYKQLKRLQAENEELNKNLISERQENAEFATENWKLCKALEEIREIAKEQKEICNIEGNCIDDRLCSTCFLGSGIELADDILSKISEVIGEQ